MTCRRAPSATGASGDNVDLLADQLVDVQGRYPQACLQQSPDGSRALIVPGVPLGGGWTAATTTVRFLVPVGFPHVKPDCFYTDAELRLAGGREPASSSLQAVFGASYRWFSWHIALWDAARGSLDQFLHVCEARLREVR